MTFVVPFDATPLSRAALDRARAVGGAFDVPVVAVTAVPANNADYARDRGWLSAGEPFDLGTVLGELEASVARTAPDAEFEHVLVGRRAPTGTIASRLRRVFRDRDATAVFIGSDDAGSIVRSVSSVSSGLTSGRGYDVVIVRNVDGGLAAGTGLGAGSGGSEADGAGNDEAGGA